MIVSRYVCQTIPTGVVLAYALMQMVAVTNPSAPFGRLVGVGLVLAAWFSLCLTTIVAAVRQPARWGRLSVVFAGAGASLGALVAIFERSEGWASVIFNVILYGLTGAFVLAGAAFVVGWVVRK